MLYLPVQLGIFFKENKGDILLSGGHPLRRQIPPRPAWTPKLWPSSPDYRHSVRELIWFARPWSPHRYRQETAARSMELSSMSPARSIHYRWIVCSKMGCWERFGNVSLVHLIDFWFRWFDLRVAGKQRPILCPLLLQASFITNESKKLCSWDLRAIYEHGLDLFSTTKLSKPIESPTHFPTKNGSSKNILPLDHLKELE